MAPKELGWDAEGIVEREPCGPSKEEIRVDWQQMRDQEGGEGFVDVWAEVLSLALCKYGRFKHVYCYTTRLVHSSVNNLANGFHSHGGQRRNQMLWWMQGIVDERRGGFASAPGVRSVQR